MKQMILCILPLTLFSCKKNEQAAHAQMPPAAVTARKIILEKIEEREILSARVAAVEQVELRPRVSGYIDKVNFQAGSIVQKDQVLFEIDPLPYQAKQAQTKAMLINAEAALTSAESQWKRVSELIAVRAISKEEADTRESGYLQAKASHAAAVAQNDAAQLDLERTKVRAPITGKISRALVTVGNQVSGVAGAGTILASIISIDPVYAYADLDENTLLRVQKLLTNKKIKTNADGHIPVELQLGDETTFPHQGWLESLDNHIEAGTGSILLRAIFPNKDEKLVPGMFARIRLPLSEEKPTVLIEDLAIKTDQGQKFVYVIDEHSLAQYRPVTLGPLYNGLRIIRDGLHEGDMVVVNGLAKIFMPGMPVAPQPAAK